MLTDENRKHYQGIKTKSVKQLEVWLPAFGRCHVVCKNNNDNNNNKDDDDNDNHIFALKMNEKGV